MILGFNISTWINIILAILTAISTFSAIYYKRKDYKIQAENKMKIFGKLELYYSRESMVKYLHTMYDRASSTDIIWGQSISGRNYGSVSDKILSAASRGVHYKMIFNKSTHSTNQVIGLFNRVDTADIVETPNTRIRLQGLSNKELMIAISSEMDYIGLLIKDEDIIQMIREWFDNRFDLIKNQQ